MSVSDEFWIRFKTNGQATARGFKLHWSRKYCVDVLDTIFDEWLYSSGGVETSYPPGASEFALDFSRVRFVRSLVFNVRF